MIRSKDVNKEVKILDEVAREESKVTDNVVLKGILKAVTLLVKLVRDVRSNQVLALEKDGVKLIKEEGREKKEASK